MFALAKSAPKFAAASKVAVRGVATRTESDLLGSLEVPADHYYGVQTMRGYNSYDISGKRLYDFPNYIKAYGMVKKAAITANMRLGLVPEDKAKAVMQACDEVISGKWNSEFIVDMIQGGAGTSTNMNTNEVITNRALEIMGHKRGDYEFISPNDIVNKCQSTNDTYPSSAKLGMYLDHFAMVEQMQLLVDSFAKKAEEFKDVMKMGRTQLQDGVPMTLGQEFHAYASTLQEDVDLVKEAAKVFLTVNLGGTAIGTGTAAHPDYSANAVKALREITGFDIKIAPDLINASSNTSGMLYFSGPAPLRHQAVSGLQRSASAGLWSSLRSIMPGKVNPVIPEVVNQTCFQIIGGDLTCGLASEAGQLELNVMEPVLIYNCFNNINMFTRATKTLRTLCVDGIVADKAQCKKLLDNSIGVVTGLLPYIGYKKCSNASKIAAQTGKSIKDVLVELGYCTKQEVEDLLVPEKMTKPNYITHKN
ncbi:Aspartate ammonia-lyase [Blastocystis sp. ATCC 50177/Nand II]|uniref:Aspartate ammonia-lyase n=1 Tax=Blastocystis sp. subtype 1 (strain ATCC 50177 / NandII) TaxID=478820 RepID=A0A196SJA7_BLAHN|nr:Aspartate ammonia-lyase [Blastocystis sp. ATCC 50177/Nand II]